MNYILLGASPYTKSLLIKIGGYRQALDGWEDMDFWMRAMVAGAKGLYLPHVIYEWHRRGQGVNSAVPLSRIWETHLRNHRFHKQFGHWELTAEGFLDFILREYEDPGVRRVVRCCGYLILPLPRHCMGRFVRALFKYVLPLGVVKQLTCLNRWHRKPSQVRRG